MKIDERKIGRMVYESLARIVNEDVQPSTDGSKIDWKPSNDANYLDISCRYDRNGTLFLNINIDNPKIIAMARSYYDGRSADTAVSKLAKQGVSMDSDEWKNAKWQQRVANDVAVVPNRNNPNEGRIAVVIKNPSTMMTEDGQINKASSDVLKILDVYKFIYNVTGVQIKGFQNTVKQAYMHAKNETTPEQAEEIKTELNDLWMKIVRQLGEEETRELLNKIKIGQLANTIIDHQYSILNKLRVINQAMKYDKDGGNQVNTISCLLTARQWHKLNRMVVSFDHPYRMVTNYGGRTNKDVEDNYRQQNNAVFASGDDPSFREKRKMNILANDRQAYGYMTFYDVQDTMPFPGMEDKADKWVNGIGYKNNITGELNDYTKAQLGTDDELGDENARKLNKIVGNEDYSNIGHIYDVVRRLSGSKDPLPKDASDGVKLTRIVNMVKGLAKQMITSTKGARVYREENAEPLAQAAATLIVWYIGLPMDKVPGLNLSDSSDAEIYALKTVVKEISDNIIKAANTEINESVQHIYENMSFDAWFDNVIKTLGVHNNDKK